MPTYPLTRKEAEIWQACDDLLAKGFLIKDITGEALAVRLRELGYKAGGLTQRYKYRDSWMVARNINREQQDDVRLQSSDPIERGVAVFREGIERELKKEYEKKVLLLEEALQQKEIVLQKVSAELVETNELLACDKQQHQQLRQHYNIQTQELHKLQDLNIQHQSTIVQLQQRLRDEAELFLQLNNKLQEQLEQNKETHHTKQDKIKEDYHKEISQLKEHSEHQRHQLIVQIDSLKHELEKSQLRFEVISQENNLLKLVNGEKDQWQTALKDTQSIFNQWIMLSEMKFTNFEEKLELPKVAIQHLTHEVKNNFIEFRKFSYENFDMLNKSITKKYTKVKKDADKPSTTNA